MRYKWYGTATLLFESGGTRLLIDPYSKRYARTAPLPEEEARTADAMFITHPHLDHFRDVDEYSEGVRTVYVSKTGLAHAQKNGLAYGCMRVIAAGDEVTVGAFRVRAYPARHCRFDAACILRIVFSPRTWLHARDCISLLTEADKYRIANDDVLAFEITDGDKTVMVFGSAGMSERADYPVGADLLVFPYQGRRRMDKELVPFLQALRPKAVAIDHFDDAFPPVTHRVDTSRFVPTVRRYLPDALAYIPDEGCWYDV